MHLSARVSPVVMFFFCTCAVSRAQAPTAPVPPPPVPVSAPPAVTIADPLFVARGLETAFTKVAETIGPATVRITTLVQDADSAHIDDGDIGDNTAPPGLDTTPRLPTPRGRSVGSGVIIRSDGYILTNDHVVEEAVDGKVRVTLSDNSAYIGTIVRDPVSDLAIVKIDVGHPLPFVHLADSSKLRVGQWAIAIGSPFDEQNTVTVGIVSALHRSNEIHDEHVARLYNDLIQTDAAINPGNSGGPLLNIDGEVIGINVAIYSTTRNNSGISFGIPAAVARRIADQLIAHGKVTRASLGIVPGDIPAFLRKRLGTEHGAYVREVADKTPADRAGLQPGDIITRFGDTEVSDETTLRSAISIATPNMPISIILLRGGQPRTLTATLTTRGASAALSAPIAPSAHHPYTAYGLGFSVHALPAPGGDGEIADPQAPHKGVEVTGVARESAADDADLAIGSIVTAVNNVPVANLEAFNKQLAILHAGDVATLSVYFPASGGAAATRGVVDIEVP